MKTKTQTSKNFATRKIKNGKVKIGGKIYSPKARFYNDIKYEGQLDGLWCVFGRYIGKDDLISLCEVIGFDFENQPNIIDKTICWLFWETQRKETK